PHHVFSVRREVLGNHGVIKFVGFGAAVAENVLEIDPDAAARGQRVTESQTNGGARPGADPQMIVRPSLRSRLRGIYRIPIALNQVSVKGILHVGTFAGVVIDSLIVRLVFGK